MYTIIDIENTGGQYNEESITEIAIYVFDGEKVVDEFVSLINPEKNLDLLSIMYQKYLELQSYHKYNKEEINFVVDIARDTK